MRVPAVLLAAGDSRRMGTPKALLKIPGKTSFLNTIVANLLAGGFEPVWLVLGKDVPRIRPYVPRKVERVFVNEHPERGQLASFQLALRHLPASVPGCLMALIDHPLILPATFQTLRRHIEENPEAIVVPSKNFKKGHPTYFPRRFFNEILRTPLDKGAREILKSHPDSIEYVLVEDDGIFVDFDTPEAYKRTFQTSRLETCLAPEEKE